MMFEVQYNEEMEAEIKRLEAMERGINSVHQASGNISEHVGVPGSTPVESDHEDMD
jgi:hypothetical protein